MLLFDRMNAANSLLIGIAYVEELLILLWRWRFRSEPVPKGSSIKRYKPLLRALGLNAETLSCWATVQDAYKIRNCLLHANGRVSFMRDSEELRACIRRHQGALDERHDRVVVTSQFLRHFVHAARELRDRMLEAQFELKATDTPA